MMETLKSLLKKKKQKHGLKKTLDIYELFGEWNRNAAEIFGNQKVRCEPKFFRGKTLYVHIQGAALASELQMRQHQLIKKINDHFDKEMVQRIVFKL